MDPDPARRIRATWYKDPERPSRRIYKIVDLVSSRVIWVGLSRDKWLELRKKAIDEYGAIDAYNQQQTTGGDQ